MNIDKKRRNLLATGATAVAGLILSSGAQATNSSQDIHPKNGSALNVNDLQPKPLPFVPAKLEGLSAKLIESHWANNYSGSIKVLNAVNKQLNQALSSADTPAFIYNDLKREHLLRTGSVILHELYFGNLGGAGKIISSMKSALVTHFGTVERWESEFRKIAQGLGGGSGWVVLGYNTHFKKLENYWMGDHAHYPVATVPLLVMDMYEHSYHMDFGAAANKYIDAFFNNINWDEVARRWADTQTKAIAVSS